jgi:probable HAF family extracellular repeat protein
MSMRRIALLSLLLAAPAAPAIELIGLGHLPGADAENPYSSAFAISSDGTTVVGESDSTNGLQAFRWTRAGGMQGLGDLPGGAFDSVANGVSPDGSVIVGGSERTGDLFVGFRWTAATGMEALPGSTGRPSVANGVAADGRFIVGVRQDTNGIAHASNWLRGEMGGYTLGVFPDLPNQGINGLAWATSNDGSVSVGYSTSNASGPTSIEATRWTASGAQPLGDLAGGGFESEARGVSADGSVVAGVGLSGTGYLAFRWTAATNIVSLGELAGGEVYSEAFAISADGSTIVGDSAVADEAIHAFIWDAANGMRDLHVLADAAAQGWTLYAASGVNADGTIVVGEGINPSGDKEAWLLDLPEPGAALGSLAALAALAAIRGRSPRGS